MPGEKIFWAIMWIIFGATLIGCATQEPIQNCVVESNLLQHDLQQSERSFFRVMPGNELMGTSLAGSINEYGDVKREVYIVQIKDGHFEVIDTIIPQ